MNYNIVDTCHIIKFENPLITNKIAAFDLDYTLIKTKSGNKFAKNSEDWKWWHKSIIKKLRKLHKKGYSIIVFTNQASRSKNYMDKLKPKLQSIASELDIPIIFYIARKKDGYRKPEVDMWNLLMQDNNINKSECFYCGDAAGRSQDFSDSDRAFAHNIGITFYTPEEYFLKEDSQKWSWRLPDPKSYLTKSSPNFIPNNKSYLTKSSPNFIPNNKDQEMLLFVGISGCGKSSYYKKYCNNYIHINRDILKTIPKCVKKCKEALESGDSVVIDNTNMSKTNRKMFIDLAKEYGIECKCLLFNTDIDDPQTRHMNIYRDRLHRNGLGGKKRTPDIAYYMFRKKYEKPEKGEGFDEIVEMKVGICKKNLREVGGYKLFKQRMSK